jgi:Tfp pilus assembly protein PilP
MSPLLTALLLGGFLEGATCFAAESQNPNPKNAASTTEKPTQDSKDSPKESHEAGDSHDLDHPAAKKAAGKKDPPEPDEAPVPSALEMKTEKLQPVNYSILKDPFKRPASTFLESELEQLPPLQRYATQQFRIQAILYGLKKPRALVTDPTGGVHQVDEGMKMGLNQGKISHIKKDHIIVHEFIFNLTGQRQPVDTLLWIETPDNPSNVSSSTVPAPQSTFSVFPSPSAKPEKQTPDSTQESPLFPSFSMPVTTSPTPSPDSKSKQGVLPDENTK